MVKVKVKTVFALVTIAGLAACAQPSSTATAPAAQPQILHSLLDSTGQVVAMVPVSAVRDTPPGTALYANINGQQQLVTLGPRVSPGASAGTAVVVGTQDGGRPVVERVTPATGNLAPSGTPYVTGTGADGRPIITYAQPGQRAPTGVVGGRRYQRVPGNLAPGVAPVVEPAR